MCVEYVRVNRVLNRYITPPFLCEQLRDEAMQPIKMSRP